MTRFGRILELCAIAVILLAGAPAFAQLTTADILGTVTDQGGAVIAGAVVTVENLATHDKRTAPSSGSGDFVFNLLPPGQYRVTVEAKGFKTTTTSLTLVSGDRARADAQLQVGETTQTVEVMATTPALQTDSSTLRDTVTAKSVQDLPLNGRNYITLVQNTVGVAPGPSNSILSGTRPDERRQTANITANGQNETFNNQLVDGMDNNEREQFTILFRPSIDSIEEVKVDINTYTAEVGRAGGAVINIVTKSGTNDFHGGLYEFFRNDKLNANDFFANSGGLARPEFRQNQFGGSLGGPIIRNKTFFFGDLEELRLIQGKNTGLLATATAYQLAHPGDFSDVGGPVVPASRIDPIALKYLALLPPANIPGAPPTANYTGNVTNQYFATAADVRVDHHFSANDSMFGRFSYNPTKTVYPTLYPPVGGVFPGNGIFPGNSTEVAQSYMVDFIHIFSPTLVAEAKGGFTRLNIQTYPSNQGTNLSDKFGIPGANVNKFVSGLMTVNINGYLGSGSDNSLGDARFVPILDINNVFQEEGALTWTRGAHNTKFGGGVIRRQLNYYQVTNGLGRFTWAASTAGAPPNSLANFLQGVPTMIERQLPLYYLYLRTWEPHIYVQDDWHASRKLTLNLGLRWDHIGQLSSATNQRSNYQIDKNQFLIGDFAGVKPNWKQFAPRIGGAYSIGKGFVIRGGFGMSYYAQDYAAGAANLSNPPFVTVNFTCQPAVVGGLTCPPGIGQLKNGPPPIAPPDVNVLLGPTLTGLPTTLGAHADHYPSAYIMQWNLTTQKQIGQNVLTVAYVGELGRHLQYAWNANQPVPSGTSVQPTFLRIKTLPNIQGITLYDIGGASEYHALQTVFERRFSRGLAISANYTFARNLTNIVNGGAAIGTVVNNRGYDWGNSDIGYKHRITIRANYELPFGKSATGFKRAVIGGWQVNTISFWQTGQPFTVIDGQNLINLPNTTSDRPNMISGQRCTVDNPHIGNFINLNAFQQQPIGNPGNEGRDQCYGPHTRSTDFSVFKDFFIQEKYRLSFRTEVYNLSNTENFGLPNATISSWTISRNPAVVPTRAGAFGQITSPNIAFYPRVFQLALKLSF
jgi:hypothetical protein